MAPKKESDVKAQAELDLPEPEKKSKKKRGLFAFLRDNFIAGILLVLPVLITFYILTFVIGLVESTVTEIIPFEERINKYVPYDMGNIVELFIALSALIFIGIIARLYVGKKLLGWWDALMLSIPGVRAIYGATKQIIETVSVSNSSSFRDVVLVEYPRKGLYAIAFVTGETRGEVQKVTDDTMVNVFLPTTPNPTSGFLLFVPKKDMIKLHMTVDQGVKMVISGGIVTPSMAEGRAALKVEKTQPKEGKTVEAGSD
ncbi:MAG: DUF502 domain-containing protein [Pseudomonadota bacterium]|nr:DUF502 domain-containing protein [Pseudomonadota bacterium]